MGKRLTLILGGARSGKSAFAQALARKRGGDSVLFVATAEARDEEMCARIETHRTARPGAWTTLETPRAVAHTLESASSTQVVLLDCLTLWVSNVLLADESAAEQAMVHDVEELLTWYHERQIELIIVSNEVGAGLVPTSKLGRAYRDLLGAMNRKLAGAADEVFWLVAGLPIEVKALSVHWEDL